MTPGEQGLFDSLTAELSRALEVFGEPAFADHHAFAVEPGWFPEILHVHVVREGATPFVFIPEGDGVRVDVGLMSEVLEFPLSSSKRFGRRSVTFGEVLPRLLTSSATVRQHKRKRSVSLADAGGEVWHRYTNYGRSERVEVPVEVSYAPIVSPESGGR